MPTVRVRKRHFGSTDDGRPVEAWLLQAGGVRAEILTYGGILHSLHVPDAAGRRDSVVLNLPTLEDYARASPYLGALVGRYANRIAGGRFTLDGRLICLPTNDRGHTLHGGPGGFDRRIWHAEPGRLPGRAAVRLNLRSPAGDMGFPGTLDVSCIYSLSAAGTLRLDYRATTDAPTPVNLTNHAYFNLSGRSGGTVLGHILALDGDGYLPTTPDGIPHGPVMPVAGTAFDFRAPRPIAPRIHADDAQLRAAGGYDHCWRLTPVPRGALRRAARLVDPGSGRHMEVWTTEPGLQVYTGNMLDGSLAGIDGKPYGRHSAICLETQHYPDSPNHPEYPDTVLRPGGTYRSVTEYRFPHLTASIR
ncbi:aldose epimerase family protein [Kitasatospora sp. NPDC001603]|uniref:aldose epimerase family protein n=1 Tax=Kitasatospora sp. NPDC001603 TaxID=3154388 RepID=UPI0033240548